MEDKMDPKLYGDPDKVIHYMDYTENPVKDNSSYLLDLVPGMLQPLEVYDDQEEIMSDKILSKLDIEAIVKQAEMFIGTVSMDSPDMEKQMNWFPDPSESAEVKHLSKKM